MLVLSRKLYESIQIGPDIEIVVCRIKSDKVMIGISAPPAVSISRTEVLQDRRDRELPEQ